MFSVEWSKEARECLKKLDRTTAKRLVEKTENIKETPYHFLRRMVGSDLWRLRIGDYRVLVQIDEVHKKLFVISLGHRKNIYK